MQLKLKDRLLRLTRLHPALRAGAAALVVLGCAGGVGVTSALAAAPEAEEPLWVLTVDGQALGAARDQGSLEDLCEAVVAEYDGADVLSLEVLSDVDIALAEDASDGGDVPQEEAAIREALSRQLRVRTVSQVTETEEVAYDTLVVEDDTLYTDESYITKGQTGQREVVSQVICVNGEPQLVKTLSSQITLEPQDAVLHMGTQERPEFIWPASGTMTSGYGYRTLFGATKLHNGIDIAGASGTAILAARAGTVVYAGWDNSGYGNLVVIEHDNNTHTYYAHNSAIYVSVGDTVEQGETIAAMGATGRVTGVHCHFEIRSGSYSGLYTAAALDPMDYL